MEWRGAENHRILYLECFMMWILCVVWGKRVSWLGCQEKKVSLSPPPVPHVFRGLLRLSWKWHCAQKCPVVCLKLPSGTLDLASCLYICKGSEFNQCARFTEFHTISSTLPVPVYRSDTALWQCLGTALLPVAGGQEKVGSHSPTECRSGLSLFSFLPFPLPFLP